MKRIDKLEKTVLAMDGELRNLRRLVNFQLAQIQALRIYAVARIAGLSKKKKEAEFEHLAKMIRKLYDEHISKIEDGNPAIAADIDLRSELSAGEQELWYLASEEFPKRGGSGAGESGDRKG